METISFKLAGKDYVVQQLTLGQLRDLAIGVVRPDAAGPEEMVKQSYDNAVAMLAVALRDGNPDMTAEAILGSRITRQEMRDACDAILTFSGLVPAGPSTGEAKAGA